MSGRDNGYWAQNTTSAVYGTRPHESKDRVNIQRGKELEKLK